MTTRKKKRSFIRARLGSFGYAFAGIATMLRTQHNAWLHALATLIVIALGFFVEVPATGWCWLILAIMAVWTAEALNTALEFLADVVIEPPNLDEGVGKAKDVAAGAVLISAIGSILIGFLVLGPPLLEKLS
jgi:diacylglycerol kinase (ATP)